MNTPKKETAYAITWLIRRLFRAMGQAAEHYLAHAGINAAERAVMEFLHPAEQLSVPEIAERYQVSRQHIQVTVNTLLEKGLVRANPNPRHKRSPLIRLSEPGRSAFAEVRRHEAAIIDDVFTGVTRECLETTRRTLQTLYDNLQKEERT